ncbi:hypothetical protein GCM10018954_026010 [Kutzneria kofuensis]
MITATPEATEPTWMVAVTVFEAVSITFSELVPSLLTYTWRPSGALVTKFGAPETGMVAVTVEVAESITETAALPWSAT